MKNKLSFSLTNKFNFKSYVTKLCDTHFLTNLISDHLQEDWVLCRVFYKSRGENSNNFIPQDLYDQSKVGDTSPNYNLGSSQTNIEPNHHQNMTISSFYESQNPSSYEERNKNISSRPSTSNHSHRLVETKCDDDYGFLFDMSIDYSTGVAPYLEDVRFDHDSSSIFI